MSHFLLSTIGFMRLVERGMKFCQIFNYDVDRRMSRRGLALISLVALFFIVCYVGISGLTKLMGYGLFKLTRVFGSRTRISLF